MKLFKLKSRAAAQVGQALLSQLPVEEKTLRRLGKLTEPKNLKRLAVLAVGGSVTVSAVGSLSRTRMVRAAVAREMKKQLEPVNKKLDALEKQNEELRKENEELLKLAQKK